jgi:murein DD-endopeptidase MepM/ murein hydrolase activator NlpD
MHTGIDIGAPYGSGVFAAESGTVAFVGAMSGYGNVIVVDHGGGLATTYNHLSSFGVSRGQTVGSGATIGGIGCSGYCTGPHLHFEVRINGSPIDPMPYFQ